MPKPTKKNAGNRNRVKVGKLQKSVGKLSKTDQKKIKGGAIGVEMAMGDGSVRTINFADGSVRKSSSN